MLWAELSLLGFYSLPPTQTSTITDCFHIDMEIVCDSLLARSPLITRNKVADNINMEIVSDKSKKCVCVRE